MGANTNIAWCHDTLNWWIGCTKISPHCAHCYASALDRMRFSKTLGGATKNNPISHWGPGAPRYLTSDDTRDAVYRWNKQPFVCEDCGLTSGFALVSHKRKDDDRRYCDGKWSRRRVFVGSLMDWADPEVPGQWRNALFDAMELCQNLTFMTLTKRGENAARYLLDRYGLDIPMNIWLGHSWMDDKPYEFGHLAQFLATRFLSVEPMLSRVTFPRKNQANIESVHMCIFGGESDQPGQPARPFNMEWLRNGIAQCRKLGVKVYVKQMGSHVIDRNDAGYEGDTPTSWPMDTMTEEIEPTVYQGAPVRVRLLDKAGADPSEWPEDVRIRELPV